MQEIIKKFSAKYEEIKRLGWVDSVDKGKGSVGITFEKLMGLESNEFEIPDFQGIEIKTKRKCSKFKDSYITLFSYRPEGKNYHEVERIKDTYGYPHKRLSEYKVLNNAVYANKKNKIGIKFYFKLDVNYLKNKIYLIVYDRSGAIIEDEVYWDFDEIKEKLYRKLKYLAIIEAKSKYNVETGKEMFNYYKLNLYVLKNFNVFLELIERGIIRINFKLNIWTSGNKIGKIHDHGTSFDILADRVEDLYKKIS